MDTMKCITSPTAKFYPYRYLICDRNPTEFLSVLFAGSLESATLMRHTTLILGKMEQVLSPISVAGRSYNQNSHHTGAPPTAPHECSPGTQLGMLKASNARLVLVAPRLSAAPGHFELPAIRADVGLRVRVRGTCKHARFRGSNPRDRMLLHVPRFTTPHAASQHRHSVSRPPFKLHLFLETTFTYQEQVRSACRFL